MMKRNILAVVIPALLVAGAANAAEIYNKDGNKLDLYGKVVGEHDFTTTGNLGGSDSSSDQSYAQIGFKGETQINDVLTGYGQWEYRAYANAPEGSQTNKTRLAFAGLKAADYGSLDYGRNYGIAYDVGSYTDMAPSYSGMTVYGNHQDNFMTARASGLLTYRNSNFFGLVDGLNFGVQYQGKNEFSNAYQSNGDGVGYSLGYDFGNGIGLISSYTNSNRTLTQQADGEGKKAETWGVGAKYDANNIYLAATYGEDRNTLLDANKDFVNKATNFEVTAQYQFDFGLRPAISYVKTKGKDLAASGDFKGGDADLAEFIQVGATYYFNKNFNVYADYYVNLLDKNDAYTKAVGGINGNDDMAAVGVTYQF
ncbi:porin [Mangrovibacter sp. MFB070]|uniref:porin n=1 Tax=Mangrovibacter sp. MFB070 TaxID=1224318 RepID=UPI0004D73EAE|nr:porin [Mangrovibacter sp. MFB070]KEA52513.1 porin [Mangrovibacter sp. MFB070]